MRIFMRTICVTLCFLPVAVDALHAQDKGSEDVRTLTTNRTMNFLLLLSAALFLLSAFLTTEASAQDPYTNGQSGQLKASDVKKLKGLKAPIAVPTYIPAGFRLKEVRATRQKDGAFAPSTLRTRGSAIP